MGRTAHLKSIQLSGFKSFVEPTPIHLPGMFCAVVGPNGCGKSNVVDAVRWVTGEISARYLRADSMAGVIFSGSAERKPLAQASVELTFDNSDGSLGGRHAGFDEILIRRQVDLDGHSNYFLNGVRCRRHDIVDVFLGTGLGPRSYAVIEQGMISRLVEGRPEDIRALVEEAAGISRYRERRRETESRIAHTRANLSRLDDLIGELDGNLRQLKKQVQAAAIHARYREREKLLQAQLAALVFGECLERIQSRQQEMAVLENGIEQEQVQLRTADRRDEELRAEYATRNQLFNDAQGQFYASRAAAARAEESLGMHRKRSEELAAAEHRLRSDREAVEQRMEADRVALQQWREEYSQLTTAVAAAQQRESDAAEALQNCEQQQWDFQQLWDEWRERLAVAGRGVDQLGSVEQALQLERDPLQGRIDELQQERSSLQQGATEGGEGPAKREWDAAERDCQQLETQLRELQDRIVDLDRQHGVAGESRQTARWALSQQRESRRALPLQDAAEDGQSDAAHDAELRAWLDKAELGGCRKLIGELNVDPAWQLAVETVLDRRLGALRVDDLETLAARLPDAPPATVDLVGATDMLGERTPAPDSLAAKLSGPAFLRSLLADVLIAENRGEALAKWSALQPGQSVISRDGLWLGCGWLRLAGESLEQKLHRLDAAITVAEGNERDADRALREIGESKTQLEAQCEQLRKELPAAIGRREELRARYNLHAERLQRAQRVDSQLEQARGRAAEIAAELKLAGPRKQAAEAELAEAEALGESMRAKRQTLQEQLSKDRQALQGCSAESKRLELDSQALDLRCQETQRGVERAVAQLQRNEKELGELTANQGESTAPIEELEALLQNRLEEHRQLEAAMAAAREALSATEQEQRTLLQRRQSLDSGMEELRAKQRTLTGQLSGLQAENAATERQVTSLGLELDTVRSGLPAEIGVADWERKLNLQQRRIERLGPVNPAAAADYERAEQRKQHLSSQREELTQTLDLLETAIQRIDRESKTMFRDTMQSINEGLQQYFQRLFGGGTASLQLLGEDPLEAGVSLSARPPGKRNTDIHQLSGGEKALAALSLLFSVFQLNPAPFCLLDEVDAPLDDSNALRFAELVREMSAQVQMICVTHNKITMEAAEYLLGVTMAEPGVSRVVGVDLAQAETMASRAVTMAEDGG